MVWAGVESPTSSHGIHRPENEQETLGLPAVLEKESKVIQHLEIHLSCLLSICWTRGGAASRVCVGNVPGAGRHSPLQPGSGGGGLGGCGRPGGPDPTLCLPVQHAPAVSGWGAFSRATALEVSALKHSR